MKIKNKGFTMIELLAAVVVLGVLMSIAIPTVMNVYSDSKNRTYVSDAIRMTTLFEAKIKKDNKMDLPAVNECIMINLTYLDDNSFNDAPNGGEYDRKKSFVLAYRKDISTYLYFPRLVEKMPGKADNMAYRGIDLINVDKLYEKNALDKYVSVVAPNKLFDLSSLNGYKVANTNELIPANEINNNYLCPAYKNQNSGNCSSMCKKIIAYIPDSSDDILTD